MGAEPASSDSTEVGVGAACARTIVRSIAFEGKPVLFTESRSVRLFFWAG